MSRRACLLRFGLLLVLGCAILTGAPVQGQVFTPPAQPNLPPPLYVKFIGPAGMKVTFYRGSVKPATVTAPFVVGLRPGYPYQVKLSDIPGHPLPIYPTLEVRGSLVSTNKVKPRDFPAALVFSDQDIEAMRTGSFISKFVVLEKVEKAFAEAATADNPIQIQTVAGEDPVRLALELGNPLLIVRLGQREANEQELQAKGLFGTIQLPDEKMMAQPVMPPYLPWACPALFDPKLGPNAPGADLCLPNGGDSEVRAAWDINGKLIGLDPSSTVAEYVDTKGHRKIAVSNRVCICVPRYVIVRSEVKLLDQSIIVALDQKKKADGNVILTTTKPVVTQHQNSMVGTLANRLSLSSTLTTLGTVAYGQIAGLELYVNINGPRGVSTACITEEGELPDVPLCLIKWPDKYGAVQGDVITFTLKFSNQGGRPIRQVVVSDSLLSRFEYVAGSQQSDRPASFTTQLNEVGAQILRWEINEELPPGQSGVIRFQVKIR